MSTATLGIDFGTTTSSMAWVDPGTGKAEMLKNAEGEEKTPSVVYFGAELVLVGTPAEQMLEDPEEGRRVVVSVKRELANAPTLALPGRRVKAVEVAAAVFTKLKRDAQELHFQEPVTRAVITCPASFDLMEREAIEAAARLAGFAEVRTLEEPVAAALAYSRAGLGVGRHVLVYDLGGGTFDLALMREEAGGFALALEPKGLRRCGGDDFDQALYDYCDEEAERQWGHPLYDVGRDLRFLRDCRRRKENLSAQDKVVFSSLVGAGRLFRHSLTRELFEGLIGGRIDTTVRLTGELVRAAEAQGFPVETVVLIGGSSRIPLVQRKLKETLPVEPRRWQHQDVAVALGAAYSAQECWQSAPNSLPRRASDRRPTSGSRSNAAFSVAPDGTGDYASIEQALAAVAEDGTIRLLPGEYRLKAPLTIAKPIRFVGAGMDVTAIVGYWEEYVISYAADGLFMAEGITFRHEGTTYADVMVASQGKVDFAQCRFTGGAMTVDGVHGDGLLLSGKVAGRIAKCRLEKNAGYGLQLRDQSQLTLEENVCEENKQAGIVYCDSTGGLARNNRCVGNEWSGIIVTHQAQPTLVENVCERNKQDGVIYFDSAGGLARNNRCIGNEGLGIGVQEQAQPTLEENVCEGNKEDGIYYFDSSGGLARNNHCIGNEESGIGVQDQAQPTLEENVCKGNKEFGIWYYGSAGGLARNNRCVGNELSGIGVQEQAQPTLEENICEGNKQCGILYLGSAGGLARNNRCIGNEWSGIGVREQAQPTLKENICEGNKQSGIGYFDSEGGLTRNNRCVGNEFFGIGVQEQAQPTLEENICEGNKLLAPQYIHGWPAEKVQALQRSVVEALGRGAVFRDRLKDGREGPEMVVIPPGSYLMGAADSDKDAFADEKPQHRVTIGQPFAIGRYTVTFDEYDRFCLATLRDKPDDKGWGRGRRPVINVSWDDAVAYCAWLSQQTGHTYRLPTEAEWEYAARAGTTTRWSFGNDEQMLREFAWFEGNSGVNIFIFDRKRKSRETHPVGEKRPNPYGLYDMHGNVREWAEDCWSNSYNGAPKDGSAWAQKPCQTRVLRGGSWCDDPRYLRSAHRYWDHSGSRGYSLGFRLARTLTP